jgi:hypothetical protein
MVVVHFIRTVLLAPVYTRRAPGVFPG